MLGEREIWMKVETRGVWIAGVILGAWIVSLVGFLAMPMMPVSWLLMPLGVLWMTFLF